MTEDVATKDEVVEEGTGEMAEDMSVEVVTPVIIDLGKTSRKKIKRLKKGRGKLSREVEEVLGEVTDALGDELEGKSVIPIVMIYEKKRKRRYRRGTLFGF